MIPKTSLLGPPHFYKAVLRIALPVMFQQFIQSMVSLIDNFMVAGLGDVSMAAVNVANQILFLFFVITASVAWGGGIFLTQYSGAKDADGMKQAYRFKVLLTLGAGIVFFILFWTIPDKLIGLMTMGNASQAEISAKGVEYLRCVSFTLLPIAISTAAGTSFRDTGNPRIPMIFSSVATLINTFGNWVLIYGNLGAPRLEITGAAIATIVARFFEAAAFIIYMKRKKIDFYAPFRTLFKVDRDLARRILSKSTMVFAADISWAVSETVMIAVYNGKGGAATVAGMAAGWTITNIFMLAMTGIVTAASVCTGKSLGEGDLDGARKQSVWLQSGSFIAGCVVALIGAGVSFLLVPLVFGNLSDEARRITLGLVLMILCYYPLWSVLNCVFFICRAGGDAVIGFFTDFIVNLGLVIPGVILLAHFTTLGPVPLVGILKLLDVLKTVVAYWFYFSERWVKNLTV